MNWTTHEVTNVVADLKNYNLYSSDIALQEAVRRAGAAPHEAELARYGALLGSEASLRMAEDANHFKPELHTFDRQGNRTDRVEFHPAWHGFMRMAREQNLVALPFNDTRPGAWAAYAAGFSMHGQIEPGSQCPNSMTFACIPVLQKESELFEQLAPKLYSHTYDARDIPFEQKSSMLVGMGMTEKQSGSDYTYAAIDVLSRRAATVLAQQGVQRGDRVALMCLNAPGFVIAMLGAWHLGAGVVPVNQKLQAPEVDYIYDS